jgi:hypothetical protein
MSQKNTIYSSYTYYNNGSISTNNWSEPEKVLAIYAKLKLAWLYEKI